MYLQTLAVECNVKLRAIQTFRFRGDLHKTLFCLPKKVKSHGVVVMFTYFR